MTKITITQTAAAETAETGANAVIQFDDGPRHAVTVQDPFTAAQEAELRWYFEEWLTFPFTGHVRAGKAAASVKTYGEALFAQLFQGEALTEYKMALRFEGGLAAMSFEVRGDPAFHGLHWEALKDPQQNRPFAVECAFIRPNNNPPAIHIRPQPSPTLNILLVSARPGGRQDVGYRTISRPLVAALRQSSLRAHIDIVRPGTYAALVDHLQQSRSRQGDGYYHLIHFDVHGSLLPYDAYQKLDAEYKATPFQYRGYGQDEIAPYEGLKAFLAFNSAEPGKPDLVADSEIGGLLQSHQIPIAILNACQSGMQVGESETSLGSRLMAQGVQIALAMGYSVTVSAAELLMATLYAQLLSGQSVHEAIRRARLELLNQKERRAAYIQRIALEDWLLPVVYQNRPLALPLTEFPSVEAEEAYFRKQASRYQAPTPTYGFFGRDVDILEIETRLLAGDGEAGGAAAHNLLLVQGMGGAGKTTLLRHLMEWWQTTRLVDRVFYFGYDTKAYTSAQIIDTMARDLYGADYGRAFSPFPDEVKAQKVAEKLRAERHLLMLDNLESITGAALSIQHTLDGVEQGRLRAFLAMLRGGRTLALLGSRGKEPWLVGDVANKRAFRETPLPGYVYELPGLDPEAASALAAGILRRLGKTHYASDAQHLADFQQLMKLLDGYPLALEIVLANLARQTPAELLAAFTAGDDAIDAAAGGDLWQDKTASILRCVEYSHSNLSPDAQALLACVAPFAGVVNTEWLPQYTAQLKAQPALARLPFDQWPPVLQEAMNWGLLTPHEMGGGYLRLQPIFPYFLRQRFNAPAQAEFQEAVNTAFRAHYDGIGRYLAQLVESKVAQERQLGLALTNLEYENLMTGLKFCLLNQVDFSLPVNVLYRYLDVMQERRLQCELGEMVWNQRDNYSRKQLEGSLA